MQMHAAVTLQEKMTFIGTADSGFTVQLGASPRVGGDGDGFKPMELMLISLAGCTAMDVISILRKKRQEISAFEVRVEAERAEEHPRVFTEIRVTYVVHGKNVDPKAVARAIELSETKYCPAQSMLREATTIRHTYEIVDAA
jgi:putative redox protein